MDKVYLHNKFAKNHDTRLGCTTQNRCQKSDKRYSPKHVCLEDIKRILHALIIVVLTLHSFGLSHFGKNNIH